MRSVQQPFFLPATSLSSSNLCPHDAPWLCAEIARNIKFRDITQNPCVCGLICQKVWEILYILDLVFGNVLLQKQEIHRGFNRSRHETITLSGYYFAACYRGFTNLHRSPGWRRFGCGSDHYTPSLVALPASDLPSLAFSHDLHGPIVIYQKRTLGHGANAESLL